jgi:carbon storage regulator
MLVLTRKVGERILVPDCALAITVVAIEGNKVRLGVSAPADTGIYREEVWNRIGEQPHVAPAKEPGCCAKGVDDP